jgi:LDH2 family malate/lactate/ureidoglycolate dehydrogenase
LISSRASSCSRRGSTCPNDKPQTRLTVERENASTALLHAKQNKPLEPGWAFDERGVPTLDPHAALRELKSAARAEGADRIYIPGEIEFETKAERLAHGIPLPEPVVQDFVTLGEELGVPFPCV